MYSIKIDTNILWKHVILLWTPEAFPGPNLRFPRKATPAQGKKNVRRNENDGHCWHFV